MPPPSAVQRAQKPNQCSFINMGIHDDPGSARQAELHQTVPVARRGYVRFLRQVHGNKINACR